jgi:hypothetical protein
MTPTTGSLEERLQRVEDQLAIYQVISAYGPSADATNMEVIKQLWHEDGIYDVDGHGYLVGHDGLQQGFDAEFHQTLVAHGAGHASTLPHVLINGDRAVATHHGTLFEHKDGRFELIRLIASRWELSRTPDETFGWRVTKRTNRLLDGSQPALELFGRLLDDSE